MKRYAVLLTVHNRCEKTLSCLDGVFCAQLPELVSVDVFMTDDGCTDGTPEAVKERYPAVHIIPGDGNLYWNHGMRKAWDAAAPGAYDAYIWLNDDVVPAASFVAELTLAAEQTQWQAIIVGATVDAETGEQTYGGRIRQRLVPCSGSLEEVEYFNGNIVLVPAAVYGKVGNLDAHFSHSGGDFDYGHRASKLGVKMFQCGQPLGTCSEHPELPSWCNPSVPFRKRWKAMHSPTGMPPKNIFYFDKNHYSLGSAVFHWITIHLRCMFPSLWVLRQCRREKKS